MATRYVQIDCSETSPHLISICFTCRPYYITTTEGEDTRGERSSSSLFQDIAAVEEATPFNNKTTVRLYLFQLFQLFLERIVGTVF